MSKLEVKNQHLSMQVIYDDSTPAYVGSGIRATLQSNDAMHFDRVIIDTESAHRIGDIFTMMKREANGTHYASDTFYDLIVALDPLWCEENNVTRQSFLK
jgi:hypothetical protein